MSPERQLYETIGPVRYVWWLLCIKAFEAVYVPGVWSGPRWWVASAFLRFSRLCRIGS